LRNFRSGHRRSGRISEKSARNWIYHIKAQSCWLLRNFDQGAVVLLHDKISTGWRRPKGCLRLQVSFRKRATNYWALLQEMTCKDKASYASSPPSTELTFEIFSYGSFSVSVEFLKSAHLRIFNIKRLFRWLLRNINSSKSQPAGHSPFAQVCMCCGVL